MKDGTAFFPEKKGKEITVIVTRQRGFLCLEREPLKYNTHELKETRY